MFTTQEQLDRSHCRHLRPSTLSKARFQNLADISHRAYIRSPADLTDILIEGTIQR